MLSRVFNGGKIINFLVLLKELVKDLKKSAVENTVPHVISSHWVEIVAHAEP